MSPISLLKLSQTKLSAVEFRTKNDENIQADILRTIPTKEQVIITTDKLLESTELMAIHMIESKTQKLMLEVVEELSAGQQYVLKLSKSSSNKSIESCLNLCGAAVVKFTVPSFKLSSGLPLDCTPKIVKEVIIVGTDFLVIDDHSGVATNNAIDCLERGDNAEFVVNDKVHELKMKSVKRLSSRTTKITLEKSMNVGVLVDALEPEIISAVHQEVMNNKTLIQAVYNETH
jgi:hypothetical protein